MSRILIIEDEITIAELEKDYLELSDFEVVIETDGKKGLERALTEDYNLYILDLMLPGMDGFEICREIREKAGELYEGFARAVDEDTEAFNLVAAAFKMPKDTDQQKEARKKAIADGTLEATKVPFRVMSMASEGLQLAERLQGHYNRNCDSDYGVGVLNLMTCMRGAWLNVKINLPGVKDEDLAKEYEESGRKMLADGEVIADRIYSEIEEEL